MSSLRNSTLRHDTPLHFTALGSLHASLVTESSHACQTCIRRHPTIASPLTMPTAAWRLM